MSFTKLRRKGICKHISGSLSSGCRISLCWKVENERQKAGFSCWVRCFDIKGSQHTANTVMRSGERLLTADQKNDFTVLYISAIHMVILSRLNPQAMNSGLRHRSFSTAFATAGLKRPTVRQLLAQRLRYAAPAQMMLAGLIGHSQRGNGAPADAGISLAGTQVSFVTK